MLKRYNSTILNYYEKYFDSIFTLHRKKIIQYVNLSIPYKIKQDQETKDNETLDWYIDITHQEASQQRNFQDWFTRQFLYSYCDTIVVNVNKSQKLIPQLKLLFYQLQNVYKAKKIPFESYEDLKLQQLELAYRKANQLLFQLQNKVEGKNKDIYIMCKDLDIQNIANIEFLKTEYTNKYLCIPQTLVNNTFEGINDDTEQFMRQNNIKLFPLQHVSSFGITDRLFKSKKYQTIFFEDDAFNSKFTDTKYPKQYLPDILLVSASTQEKSNYAIQSDIHIEEENMKYFVLQKREKEAKEEYEDLYKEMENKEYEDLEIRKSIQPGLNLLKKQRQRERRQE